LIYICGDSFGVSDLEYGDCWADIVADQFSTVNLCQIAATNLLIAQQVDQAIAASADFVIVQCTSVTRSEKLHNGKYIPFSYHTASTETTPFSKSQLQILRDYYTEFFDLKLAIYQNTITVEHTLQKLVDSGIPFCFSQGGFEHANFYPTATDYFSKFSQWRSSVNLWDYTVTREYRPYYHITDQQVHQQVADYYIEEIKKTL
jgi:hypothetical protein